MRDKNTVFQVKKTINARGRLLDLSSPKVMGILNITPDSFFAGSRLSSLDEAEAVAETMLRDGADILDLGAYSSRPGAADITAEEEKQRLLPVIMRLSSKFPQAILSVDTFRACVAEAAIGEGAHMINDISGGELDPAMFETVARLQVPYILMHMKGTPQTMNSLAEYDDLVQEVMGYLIEKTGRLRQLGLNDIIVDPGFGFAKKKNHNFSLLKSGSRLKALGLPILAGLSRKRTIWETLGTTAADALNGTTVLNTIALMQGADILRVHDVKEAVEAVRLVTALGSAAG
ncbi:dihydropteroate synthase [Arcticibacter sp. MXS-1]|uniref:dihydropteroate synthase n=1 Tax=Arcticibacter sp. MXS-1 TaxID=3341726 RepID=UPI0035A88636